MCESYSGMQKPSTKVDLLISTINGRANNGQYFAVSTLDQWSPMLPAYSILSLIFHAAILFPGREY
jgi:hypothetical protein